MMKIRKPKSRHLSIDLLEVRAVPATAAVAAAIAYQTENAQLTTINAEMAPAFTTLAASVFQAESNFYTATSDAVTSSSATTSATLQTALTTVTGAVGSAISAIETTLTPELNILPGNNTNLSAQITAVMSGGSTGSLMNVMDNLFTTASAASTTGQVSNPLFPILFTAVNNSIVGSYEAVSVDDYYYVTGQASNSSGTILPNTGNNSAESFDLATVNSAQNTAWTTAATSLFTAESSLTTTSPITTGATVATEATEAISTLTGSIASSFTSTPASGTTGPLQALLDGSDASYSLSNQVSGLVNLAATDADGSVPSAAVPLLDVAIDDAIDSFYDTTAVASFLLAVNPEYLKVQANRSSGSSGSTTTNSGTTSTGTSTGSSAGAGTFSSTGTTATTTGTTTGTTSTTTSLTGMGGTTGVGDTTGGTSIGTGTTVTGVGDSSGGTTLGTTGTGSGNDGL